MTSYQTCLGCGVDRNSCQIRASIRAGIKGLGLTSIKFNCGDRVSIFQPGERVFVKWNIPDYDDCDCYGHASWQENIWPATVVQETVDRKFVIKVDDVLSDEDMPAKEWIKNHNLFCKVRRSKLSKLNEPQRPICENCLEPVDSDGICRSSLCLQIANCL